MINLPHEFCVVVGSGISGSTAARLLAEAGYSVVLYESRKHIAGNCYDYLNHEGLFVQPYGPHIFHTNDINVWNFLGHFTEWKSYVHKVLAFIEDGTLLPFPINLDTLSILMNRDFSSAEMATFLDSEISKSEYTLPPKNFRDQVVSQVGQRLYCIFFEHYTEKQWGRDPEQLSSEVAKRIPLRFNHDNRYFTDQYQGIPRKGFSEMIQRMLDHPRIKVYLEHDYFFVNKSFNRPLLTVFTGELDRFFQYRFGKLEYRSLKMKIVTLDKERHQPVAVVNYPGKEPWTRITEFKHFYGQKNLKTTLCYEFPLAEGHPYYVVYSEENLAKRSQYIEQVNILERAGAHLFCGRLAEYRYYNMDQAIASVMSKVGEWLNKRRV